MKTTNDEVVIADVSSTGDPNHLCGDAEFADGTKYRFVIFSGVIRHLYLYKDGKYAFNDFAARAKIKASAVLDKALPLLPAAVEQAKRRMAEADAAEKARHLEALKRQAIEDAAPNLLAACKLTAQALLTLSTRLGGDFTEAESNAHAAAVAAIAEAEKYEGS